VVDEVGRDAVRFMMLYRKAEAPLDFDFAKVTEQSKDNPVFYVQYAHARVASVFRKMPNEISDLDISDEALAREQMSHIDLLFTSMNWLQSYILTGLVAKIRQNYGLLTLKMHN